MLGALRSTKKAFSLQGDALDLKATKSSNILLAKGVRENLIMALIYRILEAGIGDKLLGESSMNDISRINAEIYWTRTWFMCFMRADSRSAASICAQRCGTAGRLPSKKEVVGASLRKCNRAMARMLEKAGLKTTKKKRKIAVCQPVSLPEKVR